MNKHTLIEVQLLTLPHGEGLPTPAYESAQAAGIDLPAALAPDQTVSIAPGERALIPTGFAIALPAGHEGQIRPRSGLAVRHGVTVLNSPGTIDADYRGEIKVILINHGEDDFVIKRGQRIAQLVIASFEQAALVSVRSLGATARGSGGFGSTGTDRP